MAPRVINFVAARSQAGKTTLLEKILPLLRDKGLRVAALKGNLLSYDLDQAGKDSWRYARAGAEAAGVATADGYMLVGGTPGRKEGLAAVLDRLADFDLVLLEGGKGSSNDKIEVVRQSVNPEPLLLPGTIALATDRKDLKLDIPVFDLNDALALANFLAAQIHFKSPGENNHNTELTHLDPAGRPRMVDVSAKDLTRREATARGEIAMAPQTLALIRQGGLAKGDVFAVAQIAAIMAVKETSRIIPMAHPLNIAGVDVSFHEHPEEPARVEISVTVNLTGQTGVEMEALTGVSAAALTIYDMCKAVDKNMVIGNIRLVEKKGGRSGTYRRA